MYPAGELVRLRELEAGDLDAVCRIDGDPRVTVGLSYDTKTRDQTRATLAGIAERARSRPRTEYYLAVVTHGENRLVGVVRLGLTGVKAAKLGYAIAAADLSLIHI